MTLSKTCLLTLVALIYLLTVLIIHQINKSIPKEKEYKSLLVMILSTVAYTGIVYLLYTNSELANDEYTEDKNIKNKLKQKSEDLNVVVLITNWCSFSTKALDLHKKHGLDNTIKKIDVESEDGKKFIKKYGLKPRGFPTYFSIETGETSPGYPGPEIEDLYAKIVSLESKPKPKQKPNQKPISLIVMDGCGYCSKQKENIEENKLSNSIEILSMAEAKEKYGVTANAAPAFFSPNNTDNVLMGYRELDGNGFQDLLAELS